MPSSSKSNQPPDGLQKKDQDQLALSKSGPVISQQEREFFMVMAEVNHLLEFKMAKEEILEWTKEILRLAPNTKLVELRFVFDCFKTNRIEWNRGDGIQNFFRALNEVYFDGHGYAIKRRVW